MVSGRRSKWFSSSLPALLLLLTTACSGFFDPAPDELISRQTRYEFRRLPDFAAECREIARTNYREDADPRLIARSLIAACRATDLEPEQAEHWWLAARSCLWLSEYGESPACYDADNERTVIVDCVDLARESIRREPENAHYQYMVTLTVGLQLKSASIAKASTLLDDLIKSAKKVIKLDASLDQGGALRILGAFYQKAPPWPTGPGDLDKALALLERAVVEYPDHPLNHLFYAEALLEDDEPESAREHLARARELLTPERFLWRTEGFLQMIDKVGKRIDEEE